MKLSDFNTLEEAQAYSITNQRTISADMLTSFLDGFRLFTYFKNSNKSAESAIVLSLSREGEFNFKLNDVVGDAHIARMDDIINDPDIVNNTDDTALGGLSLHTRMTLLKQQLIGYCNSVTYPFGSTTQEEFDAAKSLQTLMETPTSVTATTGVTDVDSLDYLIRNPTDTHSGVIIIDEPLSYDDVITVTALTRSNDELNYASNPNQRASIVVRAGETGTFQAPINHTGLMRKCRYVATSRYNRNFVFHASK